MLQTTRTMAIAGLALVVMAGNAPAQRAELGTLTDAEVRQRIIEQSIADYAGVCACPYSVMADGQPCGRRSAYNRFAGTAPLCYPDDVTDRMVREFRRQ